jgi:hypothetical protein
VRDEDENSESVAAFQRSPYLWRAGLVLLGGSALLAAVAFQQATGSKAGLSFTDVDLPWYWFLRRARHS